MIYLDYTSTTPVRDEVLDTFNKVSKEFWGNPSSLHKFGILSDNLLKVAREQLRKLLDANEYEVIFTSCATESNNLAIKGVAHNSSQGKHIITSIVEHPSVYNTFRSLEEEGFDVSYLKVNKEGRISLEDLQKTIRKDTILVSLMFVNNEIGTIMPIIEVGKLLKKFPNIIFHVDMVQALGKIPVELEKMKIDLATMSSHKIYGLKGSGALFIKRGIKVKPQQIGGTQEFKLRAGTVDVPSAVSLAKAVRLILEDLDKSYDYVLKLNYKVRNFLGKYDNIVINTPIENSSPYIINFSLKDIKAETFVHAMEEYDIYISTKSACSSKLSEPSRVLKAIGLDDNLASQEIRISLSQLTIEDDIKTFEKVFDKVIKSLK